METTRNLYKVTHIDYTDSKTDVFEGDNTMNRHELINYLSKRCEINCKFADELDKAGFDIDYVHHIIYGAGESAAAANVLLSLNKC